MSKYTCEKCGREFKQKGHYTTHINKKNPCVNESKLKEIVDKAVEEKISKIKNNIIFDTVEDETIIEPLKPEDTKSSKTNIIETKNAKVVREEGLDKFYTIPSYSKKCIDKVFELYNKNNFDLIVEPSAGNGSFFNQLEFENKVGIDISPENENIVKMDFFDYHPPTHKNNILVIGNPPFGKVSSIAIKFFNHSSKWSNVIAFIIPRTFRRPSVINKLNKMFHLTYDEDVSTKPCCFSPQMMVKCCFQIWEKKDFERPFIDLPTKHEDWEFLSFGPIDEYGQPTPPNGADFAMRAYGGKIGEIVKIKLDELRPKSWHWIKSNINKEELINRFNQLDYSDSLNTARQNSMGRGELVRLYSDFINSII
jgi:hypothetical protein